MTKGRVVVDHREAWPLGRGRPLAERLMARLSRKAGYDGVFYAGKTWRSTPVKPEDEREYRFLVIGDVEANIPPIDTAIDNLYGRGIEPGAELYSENPTLADHLEQKRFVDSYAVNVTHRMWNTA